MNKRTKNFAVNVFIGLFLTSVISMNLFPVICANGSGNGFIGGVEEVKSVNGASEQIETYVIEGAGNFLNAQANIFLFLNKVEMGDLKGINHSELQVILNDAIYYMKEASLSYENLIKTAEITPYNLDVINNLKSFNYDEFAIEKKLNPIIFRKVKNLLGAGNIIGAYQLINAKFNKITALLGGLQKDTELNKTPEPDALWTLNNQCSHTLLFGQYIAEVFYELRKKL